ELTRRKSFPGNISSGINSVGSEDTVREDERWRAHSRDTNPFAFHILNRVNIGFQARLNAQTPALNAGEEPYIQALFDRFEKIHHQMMRDVVAAKRQRIFISSPIAFHQFRLQPFLLEKALLVSGVNRSFARQPDVADTDFI